MKGVVRFGKKQKLSLRYVGPCECNTQKKSICKVEPKIRFRSHFRSFRDKTQKDVHDIWKAV